MNMEDDDADAAAAGDDDASTYQACMASDYL